ncbi:DDE-type integrase/transposase/recombinase [Parendozoicomonas sp. Alg238-R29]|uniref:DDE-type integrase/transposase/recombinase n=1 Tax=Parendozoicomonas sp. Alg238-R29 TaxID=2993446 RepID=UPI00248F0E85|nr:DDE-type integrase/transposase/recombinase [Parendozoicomonas sp. Alg238-R29]
MTFSGRHFPKDIILQAVRWYITYPLSLRMIKEVLLIAFLPKSEIKSCQGLFRKAIRQHGQPEKVSIDKSGSNISALTSINTTFKDKEPKITIYPSKYLNNIVEEDHRFVKRITRTMMQFKGFYSAKAALAGIALSHMLRKGQYSDSESTKPWEYFYSLTA